jgi:hypothetical protein
MGTNRNLQEPRAALVRRLLSAFQADADSTSLATPIPATATAQQPTQVRMEQRSAEQIFSSRNGRSLQLRVPRIRLQRPDGHLRLVPSGLRDGLQRQVHAIVRCRLALAAVAYPLAAIPTPALATTQPFTSTTLPARWSANSTTRQSECAPPQWVTSCRPSPSLTSDFRSLAVPRRTATTEDHRRTATQMGKCRSWTITPTRPANAALVAGAKPTATWAVSLNFRSFGFANKCSQPRPARQAASAP